MLFVKFRRPVVVPSNKKDAQTVGLFMLHAVQDMD